MTESLPATDHSDLAHTNHCDAFAFSEREQLALDLYNELRELELQESLLRAQAEGRHSNALVQISDFLSDAITF